MDLEQKRQPFLNFELKRIFFRVEFVQTFRIMNSEFCKEGGNIDTAPGSWDPVQSS